MTTFLFANRAARGSRALALAALFSALFASASASAAPVPGNPRPIDWIVHAPIAITDSRAKPRSISGEAPHIEVVELPYPAAFPEAGTILLIPGLFQNGASFDLLPEQGVSIARFFMREFRLHVYLLHVRGLGSAGGSRRLNLDDFAIDDIPAAIRWVRARAGAPITVLGHSQGAIMLQASLAGLTRGPDGNRFDARVADARQTDVSGVALSAGSVSMATENPDNHLPILGDLGHILKLPLGLLVDRIDVADLVNAPILRGLGRLPLFEFLYHRANVSPAAETALYRRSLEASWSGVILQFAEGVRHANIATVGKHPEPYMAGLPNIRKPVVQVTYGLDPMAEPEATRTTSFAYLGSPAKQFYANPDQGHEDWMMSVALHEDWRAPMTWLLNR